MDEERMGLAGNGSEGVWDVCVDEHVQTGDYDLVIDYVGLMKLSDDCKQVQISLDVPEDIDDLIKALQQERKIWSARSSEDSSNRFLICRS